MKDRESKRSIYYRTIIALLIDSEIIDESEAKAMADSVLSDKDISYREALDVTIGYIEARLGTVHKMGDIHDFFEDLHEDSNSMYVSIDNYKFIQDILDNPGEPPEALNDLFKYDIEGKDD